MKRDLRLRHEYLADLSTDDLAGVHAGAIPTLLGICQWTQPTSPIKCVTEHTVCDCR